MGHWTEEELEASVDAYADLFERHSRGEQIVKKRSYEDLSQRYGRSPSSFEFRFQNISHVLATMGLPWLPGLRPADHVGQTAMTTLRRLIETKNYFGEALATPTADSDALERRTSALVKRGVQTPPTGTREPAQVVSQTVQFVRNPQVKAWVLEAAAGHCESCLQPAPFIKEDGLPFLEVHHLKWLATGGSDTITNAVALCPNCHRRFHHGADAQQVESAIYGRVPRLVRE